MENKKKLVITIGPDDFVDDVVNGRFNPELQLVYYDLIGDGVTRELVQEKAKELVLSPIEVLLDGFDPNVSYLFFPKIDANIGCGSRTSLWTACGCRIDIETLHPIPSVRGVRITDYNQTNGGHGLVITNLVLSVVDALDAELDYSDLSEAYQRMNEATAEHGEDGPAQAV